MHLNIPLTSCSFLNFQLDDIPKREASVQQRMELQKEVDALRVSFEKQVGMNGPSIDPFASSY